MEKDDEVKGIGNSYNTQYRIYDPRIGRWLSLDPKISIFPDQSPYNFANNTPIFGNDPNGDICIPCVVALVGLLTVPAIVNAPTLNPQVDAEALRKARETQTKWLLFSIGGTGAMTARLSATTIAKELTSQFFVQYTANIAVQAYNRTAGDGPPLNFKEAFSSAIKGLDFADALIGSSGASDLVKNIFSSAIDITPEEAKVLGLDKSAKSATIDFVINKIGDKIKAPDTQYGSIINKIKSSAETIVNDAIKTKIGETNAALDSQNFEYSQPDALKVEMPAPVGITREKE